MIVTIQTFLAVAKLLPKLLIELKIFIKDHSSEVFLCFLALFFRIPKITPILLWSKIWCPILGDGKHVVPYSCVEFCQQSEAEEIVTGIEIEYYITTVNTLHIFTFLAIQTTP